MASRVTAAEHRARHFYLASICRRLLLSGLTSAQVPPVFGIDTATLERWLWLYQVPPAYVVGLGAGGYGIRPPRFAWYDWPRFWCQAKLPRLLHRSISNRPVG